jgi:hypothetical protein
MTGHRLSTLLLAGAVALLSAVEARAQATTMQARPAVPVKAPPASPPPAVPQANTVTRRALSPEERIALLEAALQKAEQRIIALEGRLNAHTHTYQYMLSGLLREPLNGRPVDLAISPHITTGTTSSPR